MANSQAKTKGTKDDFQRNERCGGGSSSDASLFVVNMTQVGNSYDYNVQGDKTAREIIEAADAGKSVWFYEYGGDRKQQLLRIEISSASIVFRVYDRSFISSGIDAYPTYSNSGGSIGS